MINNVSKSDLYRYSYCQEPYVNIRQPTYWMSGPLISGSLLSTFSWWRNYSYDAFHLAPSNKDNEIGTNRACKIVINQRQQCRKSTWIAFICAVEQLREVHLWSAVILSRSCLVTNISVHPLVHNHFVLFFLFPFLASRMGTIKLCHDSLLGFFWKRDGHFSI